MCKVGIHSGPGGLFRDLKERMDVSKLKHGGELSKSHCHQMALCPGPWSSPPESGEASSGTVGRGNPTSGEAQIGNDTPSRHKGSEMDGKRGPRARAKEKGCGASLFASNKAGVSLSSFFLFFE